MRKLIFSASAVLLLSLIACNDNTKVASATADNSKVQRNLDASRAVARAIETGDVSAIDSVVAEDFVDHTDHGDIKGRDSLKAMAKTVQAHMKNMKMNVKHEIADENYVYAWMHFSGTSDGAMGMPAGPYDMTSMEVSRLNDGKIVEHWTFMDMQELGKMMQMMQGMNNNPGAVPDSSKTKK